MVGQVLAERWRLVRLLGEGAMGAVFLAEDTAGQGHRAVKVLHLEFVGEQQVVSRFYAEAEASQRLVHPNIARIFQSGTAPWGAPFLIMELLRGKSLGDAVPPGAKMATAEAAWVMQGVLQALAAAHAQEIVHRDLKPDNIYLCENPDGTRTVKLLDFGIAKVIEQATGGKTRKTATGMVLGTPGYMSPEQLKNSKAVDPRSDLWSLGVVFYEIMTGYDPFGVANDMNRMFKILTEDAPPIDTNEPSLAPWRPFFQRALQRDVANRFQTAMEMHDAITAMLAGRPLPPPAPPIDAPKVAEPAPPPQASARAPTAFAPAPVSAAAMSAPAVSAPAPQSAAASAPVQSAPSGPNPSKSAAPPLAVQPPAKSGLGPAVWLGVGAVLLLVVIAAMVIGVSMTRAGGKGASTASPPAPAASGKAPPPAKKR